MKRIDHLVRSVLQQRSLTIARSSKCNGVFLFSVIVLAILLTVSAGAIPADALDPGALPTGGRITSGQGSVVSSGNQMTVTQQQNKMIVDWDTFNIGRNAGVTFVQPNASSSALNRVSGQNPSQIFGSLKANGQVFLINPSGIVFGRTAQVDVGGLVASSLKITDQDYLSGNFRFTLDGYAGAIINRGTIKTSDHGIVALIAPQVNNQGTITAPNGTVSLAAGNRVSLDFAGDGLMKVSVDEAALNAAVENGGAIRTDAGQVIMTAKAAQGLVGTVVKNTGIIEANSIGERNGTIVLDGGDHGIVSSSGTISAQGKQCR